MTTVRALRTPPNTDDLAAAVAPVINGEAKEVIAEAAQPSAAPVQAPPLGQGAVAAIMRAVDDSCDEIQGTVDMLVDLQAKLHSEAGELAAHITQYTAMAGAIASAFKDFKKAGVRNLRGDDETG
jgi:hypothetical protein